MSLRRFRIKAADHDKVHAWLKKQKVDPLEDEKSPEPLAEMGFRMPADYLPKVGWAHIVPLKLEKAAHGKEVMMGQEAGVWKRLVHEQQIDGYLREALLSSSADVPLSRDAGHHIVQKRTLGISRRAFAKSNRRSCKSPGTSCRRRSSRAGRSRAAATSRSTSWRRRAATSASSCTTPSRTSTGSP